MNRLIQTLFSLLMVTALAGLGHSRTQTPEFQRQEAWDQETIDLFSTLPVLNGGRVKPMESLAGLRLLMLNGKRTLKLESGEKLKPSAWAMDAIFFPADARRQNCIRIENDAVLIDLGLASKKKRDWYNYNELLPARAAISREAGRAAGKDAADRNPVERQMLKLDIDLSNFEALLGMLEPLRLNFDVSESARLTQIFGSKVVVSQVDVFKQIDALIALQSDPDPSAEADRVVLGKLFRGMDQARSRGGSGPSLVPPAEGMQDGDSWWRVGDLVDLGMLDMGGTTISVDAQLEALNYIDQMERSKMDRPAFRAALTRLHGKLETLANAEGVYAHIGQEVALTRLDPFTKALVFFLLAFLLLAVSLLTTKFKVLNYGVWGLSLLAFGFLTYGIVMRCIIRERPPVVTLYDTILFVSAIAILAAFIMEWMLRIRVALGLAVVLGVVGMFLAGRYELKEVASAGDTMASVVAVLDTNYYLAIHVTTIAIGYSGGLLAAAIGHVWILGKLFRYREGDKAFYKSVTRMTYGAVCFALFFALFGTVMGGIWANDSWGRFWGWDPKENGALLICLWLLLTLHMRMGGYIRDRGLAAMAVGAGSVVAASWWGVNLLSVGLHSYGFTSGIAMILLGFWTLEALVLVACMVDHFLRNAAPPAQTA